MQSTCSIGGYYLEGITERRGRDGHGYEATLCSKYTKVAYLQDAGDGSEVEVHFVPEITELDRQKVLTDMKELLSYLKPILSDTGLYKTYISTPYGAAMLMAELLLELKELVSVSNKAYKQLGEDALYAVGVQGSSFFSNEGIGTGTNIFCFQLDEGVVFDEARKALIDYAKRMEDGKGPLRQGAILKGKMDWNLTFEEYAELSMP